MVNCPVCGLMGGMGDLIVRGHGTETELRYEHLHVLEVHAGRVAGELILDIDRLREVLGVGDLPLVERVDERLQQVLVPLWEIQNSVLQQFYTYSSDMSKKRREGYLTTWQGRTMRVWFSYGHAGSQPCPTCGFGQWDHTLSISLAEGDTRVDVPVQALHLMEVHGQTEFAGWQVWEHPGDYEKLCDFFGIAK